MTKYCCDRCGREITNPGEMSYIDLFPIRLPETLLCDKCIEDLKNWYHKESAPCGHWIYSGYDEVIGEFMYDCSCCGGISDGMYFYCKDCGAKMDEDSEVDNNESL